MLFYFHRVLGVLRGGGPCSVTAACWPRFAADDSSGRGRPSSGSHRRCEPSLRSPLRGPATPADLKVRRRTIRYHLRWGSVAMATSTSHKRSVYSHRAAWKQPSSACRRQACGALGPRSGCPRQGGMPSTASRKLPLHDSSARGSASSSSAPASWSYALWGNLRRNFGGR